MSIERYPLTWPADKSRTPAKERKRAAFAKKVHNGSWNVNKKLSVADAVSRVEKELAGYTKVGHTFRVPPESIIISTNLNVSVKGKPLSVLRDPEDPGVAVYFKLDGKNYCLPCDKWDRVADNLAAVAAHISALRGIERWGVGSTEDAYTGFKALPQNAGASQNSWQQILQLDTLFDWDDVKAAYRRLVNYYHPDKPNANADMFNLVQQAYQQALVAFGKEKKT